MPAIFRSIFGRLSIVIIMLMLLRCDSGLRGQLEYADYLLDEGNFEDAITLLIVLDNQYPGSVEVKSKLASAHMAHALLDSGATYLTLVASYFEETEAGKSEFQQFSENSPDLTTEDIAELSLARKILDEDIPDGSKRSREWLQLGFARLMEINAIGVVKTGANSEDIVCNSDPDNPALGPEGIPDDYDPDALTSEENARFNENVNKVGSDFVNAGLSSDISIIQTVEKIKEDLNAASNLEDYLNTQYGVGTPCPPAP